MTPSDFGTVGRYSGSRHTRFTTHCTAGLNSLTLTHSIKGRQPSVQSTTGDRDRDLAVRRASFVSTRSALAKRALDHIGTPGTLQRNRGLSSGSRMSNSTALSRISALNADLSRDGHDFNVDTRVIKEEEEDDDDGVASDDDMEGLDEDMEGDTTLVSERIHDAFDLPQIEPYKGGTCFAAGYNCHCLLIQHEIVEFACYLARSVLLKGYMFVTSAHICFYANLPREQVWFNLHFSEMQSATTLSAPTI